MNQRQQAGILGVGVGVGARVCKLSLYHCADRCAVESFDYMWGVNILCGLPSSSSAVIVSVWTDAP